MRDAYTGMITLLLAASIFPCLTLAWMLRPHPWKYILRGGDAVPFVVLGQDFLYRLIYNLAGKPIPYPGDSWAIARLLVLGFGGVLMWAKLDQVLRHKRRNRQAQAEGRRYLEAQGIDVDAEIAAERQRKKDGQ